MNIKSIVCPVDFSGRAMRGFEYAKTLARHLGATLYVIHIVPTLQYAGYLDEMMPVIGDEFYEKMVKQAQEELSKLASEEESLDIRTEVRTGNPYAEILNFSESVGADLIVMSSQGSGGIAEFLFGGTAEKILRKCACPVLVVPVRKTERKEAQGGGAEDSS